METNTKNLTQRSLNATKWSYIGTIGRIVSQVVTTIILARVLGPEAFGLFAITLLATGICGIVVDMGLGSALVQKQDITKKDIDKVWTLTMMCSLVIASLLFISAETLSGLYTNAELVPLLQGSAIYLVCFCLGIVPSSVLKRNLQLKELQITQLTSYLVGFLLVGVGCGFAGVGATSLIIAYITQSIIFTALSFFFSKYQIRVLFSHDISELRHFGRKVLLNNLSNWTTENMDNLLIGKFFGMTPLGLYSIAYNLVRTPTNHIVTSLQSVLFSTASRAQKKQNKLASAYLGILSLVALVSFPIFFSMASISETLIVTLYGQAWSPSSTILIPLAIAMPFHALMAVAGPVMGGKGDIHRELIVQFFVAILFVLAIVIAAQFSILAVAWAVSIVYFVRFLWIMYQANISLSLTWSTLFEAMTPGLCVALVTCPVIYLIDSYQLGFNYSSALILSGDILAAALISLISIAMMKNVFFPRNAIWLLSELHKRLPNSWKWASALFLPELSSTPK